MFDAVRKLREAGVLGVNERNSSFIMRLNPRRLYPRVDDKALTKELALAAGMPVPDGVGQRLLNRPVQRQLRRRTGLGNPRWRVDVDLHGAVVPRQVSSRRARSGVGLQRGVALGLRLKCALVHTVRRLEALLSALHLGKGEAARPANIGFESRTEEGPLCRRLGALLEGLRTVVDSGSIW